MPGFELERVDGGDPIDLPCGETVVGRGPFLGVSDKRVSRSHGILENLEGELRLKPIHLNPCFIQASLEAAPEPLEKGQWHCLKDGSIFSLLPGKYVYRVRAVSEEGTLSNSQDFQEDKNTKSSRVCEDTLAYTPQAKRSTSLSVGSTKQGSMEEMEVETLTPGPASSRQTVPPSKADGPDPPTPRRSRVLPAWMMAAAPVALGPSPVKAKQTPVRAAQKPAQPKRPAGPKQARARQPSSEEEEEGEEEEDSEVLQKPKKRAKRLKSDTEESQHQAPVQKPSQEKSQEEEEEGKGRGKKKSEDVLMSAAGGSASGNSQIKQPSQNGQQTSKVTGSDTSSSSNPKVQRRTPCPYGASCYRKNPLHFQECSHPGDNDYEEEHSSGERDDEDDDRPECPYGTDCYRKNLLHKKEYKHTKAPVKSSVPDDDDEEDEDRYENSFIDDESEEEEVDEDSDYVPESDGSDKEDIKRLQKEAKAFLKRKK